MKRILIIEDDLAIQRGLKDNLEYGSYEVLAAGDGIQGLKLFDTKEIDLIILDLMLPGIDGYEVCRRIREKGHSVPILMLTARGEEMDRVLGLDLGADDYVTKPFSIPELLARIRALLRRTESDKGEALPDSLSFANVRIDFKRYEAHKGEKHLELSRKEFGLLRRLAARPGEVISRDELLDLVWEDDSYPTTRTVDNHIALLRSKLEDIPARPRFLKTVHGVGYKLILDI